MKLKSEDQVLDQEFRFKVIKEIIGEENVRRKADSKKRYDIFKDKTRRFVEEALSKELSAETFQEMKHRIPNLSIFRKIIDKKAVVYKDGAIRDADDELFQSQLDFYVDYLNLNTHMKKVNRYLESHRNTTAYVLPYTNPLTGKKRVMLREMLPHLYDVLEDASNPEIPRGYIFSWYTPDVKTRTKEPNKAGVRGPKDGSKFWRSTSDGKDQIIADSPEDAGADGAEFVWWTNKYHFTTDIKGEYINVNMELPEGERLKNPIEVLPLVNFSKDQDGQFWALGGDDLVDGSILINQLLADTYFIQKLQGMGIFYMAGKGLPKKYKVGPSDAIIVNKEEGDPSLEIGFASSNPPLDAHLRVIEQYTALLLSTNNLEPGTIQGDLNATTAASGIQELIKRSENMDSVQDQQEVYRDNEPYIFYLIAKWHNLLFDKNLLDDDLRQIGKINEDASYTLSFPEPKIFTSEKEKLEVLEKRRDLKLDTMIDTLMRDNPDLTKEEAELKLKEILEERLKMSSIRMKMFGGNENGSTENDGDTDNRAETDKGHTPDEGKSGKDDSEDGSNS